MVSALVRADGLLLGAGAISQAQGEGHGQREQHRDDQVGEGQDESAANLRGLSLDRRYVASFAATSSADANRNPTPRTVTM